MPFCACSLVNSLAQLIDMVAMLMWTIGLAAAARACSTMMSRTVSSSDSIEMTASPWNASLGDAATIAPRAASSCAGAGERFHTRKRWPALSRLSAMGLPMLPSPMNPMSMMPSPSRRRAQKRRADFLRRCGRAFAVELAGDAPVGEDVGSFGDGDRVHDALLRHQHGEPAPGLKLLHRREHPVDRHRGEPDGRLVDQ